MGAMPAGETVPANQLHYQVDHGDEHADNSAYAAENRNARRRLCFCMGSNAEHGGVRQTIKLLWVLPALQRRAAHRESPCHGVSQLSHDSP